LEKIGKFNGGGFPEYKNLIDEKKWKKIQDSFAEILNIGLKTVNKEGETLVEASGYNPCEKLSQISPLKENICRICLDGVKSIWGENYFYSCPLGFNYQAIPVEPIEEKVIAYIIAGPFLMIRRKNKEEIKNIARQYKIDYELLYDSFIRTRVISFQMLESTKRLLYEVMQCISQYFYQKYTLIEVLPQWQKLKDTIGAYYFDKFVNVLVEMISKNATAERISLMFYNQEEDELYIKAGTGISNEILKHTRIKLGERIAGLAAKEMKTIIIEEDNTDEKIKSRMSNPELKSAVVMPFHHEGKLIGVINIGTSKRKRFSKSSLKLVSELMNLSAVAILGMQSVA
jgi:putative methionine-R-sulfoxide reductase with GAF domain/ligand-binding sensor protein